MIISRDGRVPIRGWILAAISFVAWSGASAQDHEHKQAEHTRDVSAQVILTGKLVDATWFDDSAGQDPVARASERMAAGIPAGILPEGGGKPEDILYLLTSAAPLAPYAGK